MCEHCETFKHKISELTIQISKQHSQIQSLQSKLSTETSSINNTSSEYPLPSEIKQTWEYISQFSLFDSFEEVITENKPKAYRLIKHIVTYIEQYTSSIIENKLKSIQKALNIENTKLNTLYKQISFLFKSNFHSVFIKNINISSIITELSLDNECSNMKSLYELISLLCKICFYMKLHDPPLSFCYNDANIPTYFAKSLYECVDGFIQEGHPCFVLLPYPTNKDNYNYLNVKSIVIESNTNMKLNGSSRKVNGIHRKEAMSSRQNDSGSNNNNNNSLFHKGNNDTSFCKCNSTVIIHNHINTNIDKIHNMKQKSSEHKAHLQFVFKDYSKEVRRNSKHKTNHNYNQLLYFTNITNNNEKNNTTQFNINNHTITKGKDKRSIFNNNANLVYDESNKENINCKVSFHSTAKISHKRKCNMTYRRNSVGNKITYVPLSSVTMNKINSSNCIDNLPYSNKPVSSTSVKKIIRF